MGCYNRDTAEYRTLQKGFKNNLLIDILIEKWQGNNDTERLPNTNELKDYLDKSKASFSLKRKDFKEAILSNLSRKKIISKYYGDYYINTTNKETQIGDYKILKNNVSKALSWLNFWGISRESVVLQKTINSYKFDISENIFTPSDLLQESQIKNATHIPKVLEHLNRMFPQVSYDVVSVKEAKKYYDQLPSWKKSNVPFSEIRSYIVDNKAKIIKGRVTTDTAVEEVLHPFVSAIKEENSSLFDGLLKEAETNYPQLRQQIEDSYSDIRNFDNNDRKEEFITQALSRHFNKEFEQTPTVGWKNKIREVLKFLIDVIKDLFKYASGETLNMKVGMINSKTNLSDIAKLLNTEDLQFTFQKETIDKAPKKKVNYSLSPRLERIYNRAIAKSNPFQKQILQKLYYKSIQSEQVFDDLTIAPFVTGTNSPLMILDKKTHTYKNVEAPNQKWQSATQSFKGFMLQKYDIKKGETLEDIIKDKGFTEKQIIEVNPKEWDIKNLLNSKDADGTRLKKIFLPETRYQLQRDLGNDFDVLLENILNLVPFEEIEDQFTILNRQQAKKTYQDLQTNIAKEMPGEDVIYMPQVVVGNPDPMHRIAGTIDILRIDKNGVLSIIDLKTSGNSVNNADKYNRPYSIGHGSVLFDPSLDLDKQIKLSTRGQHGMQVGIYARILENMGFKVDKEYSQTYHINIEYIGKEGEKKYIDKWEPEGFILHPPSINQDYVNKIVPLSVDPLSVEQLNKIKIETGDIEEELDVEILGPEENIEGELGEDWRVYYEGLIEYKGIMQGQKTIIDGYDDRKKLMKSKKQYIDQIDDATTAINIATEETGDVLPVYSKLLRNARDEALEFIEYVEDPDVVRDNDFVARVMNFQRYARGWYNLANIGKGEGLSLEQIKIQTELSRLFNSIMGVTDPNGVVIEQGKITEAIFDFVADLTHKETINPELKADQDLISDLVRSGEDMGLMEWATGDMSTAKDPLAQIMVKIWKRNRQKVLDIIEKRTIEINKSAHRVITEQRKVGEKENWDWMYRFDKDREFSGSEIEKIGEQYHSLERQRYDDLSDEEGNWKFYIKTGEDKKELTSRDKKENIELFNKKQKWKDFKKAEQVVDGRIVDGDYHKYTDEFKKVRAQYETPSIITLQSGQQFITYERKNNVSSLAYTKYKVKHYHSSVYERPILENGVFNGVTISENGTWPKSDKHVEVRETSRKAELAGKKYDMLDEQYVKIMSAPTNPLDAAKQDFYKIYMKNKEELLAKIPSSQRNKLEGKSFAMMDTLSEHLQKSPDMFTTMWAETKSKVTSYFSPENWTNVEARVQMTNDKGRMIDSLPIFYTGSPISEKAMEKLKAKRNANKAEWDAKKITKKEYKERKDEINQQLKKLHDRPTKKQMSRDAPLNLSMFAGMAENYEIMSSIEDTMRAFQDTFSRRSYKDSDYKVVAAVQDGVRSGIKSTIGLRGNSLMESRVKKWMKMTFYDNDKQTKRWYDHVSNGAIGLSSLTYVAFAPFGNFNNYMVGRLSNWIESAGASFFCRECYVRAVKELNVKALPGVLIGLAATDAASGMIGQATGMKTTKYQEVNPHSKYEALVNYFRMMDDKADIREVTMSTKGSGRSGIREKLSWGYAMQDAAEWNVQTKVGIAILMSHKLENSKTGDQLSLYDAMTYDNSTGEIIVKDGYDTLVEYHTGNKRKWNDDARRDTRNFIREVNKQIHGNYAYEDRMAMQSHALGQLLAQFHKWIAPVFKRRFRGAYYDENVGWIEGRYRTLWSFMSHAGEVAMGINKQPGTMKKKIWDFWNEDTSAEDPMHKARIRKQNMIGNVMDVSLVLLSIQLASILDSLWDEDDEDKLVMRKRLENAFIYQLRRQSSEFAFWYPVVGMGELFKMTKSPIASTRYMSELWEAVSLTAHMPFLKAGAGLLPWQTDKKLLKDKRLYYQVGSRKGQSKLYKQWGDVLPIIKSINRYISHDKVKDFYVN
mgnify:CR=1 FL=1